MAMMTLCQRSSWDLGVGKDAEGPGQGRNLVEKFKVLKNLSLQVLVRNFKYRARGPWEPLQIGRLFS